MSRSTSTRHLRVISRLSNDQLSALLRVSSDLAGTLDLDEVLQTAIQSAVTVLGLDTGAIYVLEDDSLLLGATTPSLPPDLPVEFRREARADHPQIDRCLRDLEPVVVSDAATAPLSPAERAVCDARGLRSILFVPLEVSDIPVGAFIVASTADVRHFSDADVDTCKALAHEIGLALANARLFESAQDAREELEYAYDATLEGWSLALEMRDDGTNGHAQRVTALTAELARSLGVPEDDIVHLRRGALLHDIGKMVVPDAILHKPGPLTAEEWEIMRRHPDSAREFLAKVPYLAPALDIPYCHHERWDGSGYPRGLAGEAIPLAARVFAVIDVYDALTSDRPYRDAWSEEEALEHIREGAGRHFDPRVAHEFLRLMTVTAESA